MKNRNKLVLVFILMIVFINGCAEISTLTPFETAVPIGSSPPLINTLVHETPAPLQNESEVDIGQLLKEGVSCEKPCFWGIIPNETDIERARETLNNLGLRLIKTTTNHFSTGFTSKEDIRGEIILTERENNIKNIRVNIGGLSMPNVRYEDWYSLTPIGLLSEHGQPSRVRFFIDYPHEPNQATGKAKIDLIMFFNEIDVVAYYSGGLVEETDGSFSFCPDEMDITGISLWYGKDVEGVPYRDEGESLEALSGLSISEFYHSLLEKPEICINLKTPAGRP